MEITARTGRKGAGRTWPKERIAGRRGWPNRSEAAGLPGRSAHIRLKSRPAQGPGVAGTAFHESHEPPRERASSAKGRAFCRERTSLAKSREWCRKSADGRGKCP